MNKMVNYYLEKSEKLVILDFILGIMQIMNKPIRLLWFIFPIGVSGLGMMHYCGQIQIPKVPERVIPYINKTIPYLLPVILVGGMMVFVYLFGTALRNKETEVFKKALNGTNEDVGVIKLIYKREKNGIIERRIYNDTVASVWNSKQVYPYILRNFNEHFWKEQFKEDPNNSKVTIMKTKEKYTVPDRREYRDEALEREMGIMA